MAPYGSLPPCTSCVNESRIFESWHVVWVMLHMYSSCHIWMRNSSESMGVTGQSDTVYTWVTSHMYESCHIHLNNVTHLWVMSNICIRHVIYECGIHWNLWESWAKAIRYMYDLLYICMSHVTYEPCHICMSHVTQNMSHVRYRWVVLFASMGVTGHRDMVYVFVALRMYESCHICMSHVKYKWVIHWNIWKLLTTEI